MRRRWVILCVAVVIVLCGAWTGLWFYMTGEVRRGFLRFVEQQVTAGAQVEYRSFDVGGFPLGWTIVAQEVVFTQQIPAPRSWHGERVVVTVRPWSFRTLHIRPEGTQQITSGPAQIITATAAEPDLWVTLDAANRPQRIVAELRALLLRGAPQESPLQVASLSADFRALNPAQPSSATPFLEGRLALYDAVLPDHIRAALGQRIQRLELQANITGEWPALRTAQAVARWRDSGGKIDITRLVLTWAPLDAEGDGTLALDQANQLLGAGTLRVRGHNETIDALVRAQVMRPTVGVGAKLMLSPLARPAADGRPQIQAPITAQNGRLSINNLPLLVLPPLRFE
jgi:Uncharacterized protein conserved in bacteria (DUF2125)